MQASAKPVMWI